MARGPFAASPFRAEQGEGVSDEDELQVSTVLTGRVPGTALPMSSAILAAATPVEAFHQGAFQLLTAEYDCTDVSSLRRYVDNAYLKTPPVMRRDLVVKPIQGWRDHSTFVFALAKADSDPTTAVHCSGCSSIEITFRDWIGPFVVVRFEGRQREQRQLVLPPRPPGRIAAAELLLDAQLTGLAGTPTPWLEAKPLWLALRAASGQVTC